MREVKGDVGKGEMREMWGSVLGPHTLTHFSAPPPFLSPLANTLPHSSHTFSCTLPYTSSHSSPHLPLHPNTLPHIFPHSFNYVAKLPYHATMLPYLNKFKWKSSIKFFMTTRNLKSCFGVGNVNFRCMKVWRNYCGKVTGNHYFAIFLTYRILYIFLILIRKCLFCRITANNNKSNLFMYEFSL